MSKEIEILNFLKFYRNIIESDINIMCKYRAAYNLYYSISPMDKYDNYTLFTFKDIRKLSSDIDFISQACDNKISYLQYQFINSIDRPCYFKDILNDYCSNNIPYSLYPPLDECLINEKEKGFLYFAKVYAVFYSKSLSEIVNNLTIIDNLNNFNFFIFSFNGEKWEVKGTNKIDTEDTKENNKTIVESKEKTK